MKRAKKTFSKEEILQNLLKDELTNQNTFVFLIENSKFTENIGFFKFEVMEAKSTKVIFKFKIQVDPDSPENKITFSKIKIGDSNFQVGLVQLESKNILSRLKEGFNEAIGEGRIPYIGGMFS